MLKKLPKSEVEITLTIPWEEWKKYLEIAAAEASEELKIPGFRPGKAPRHLVEQKVGKSPLLNNAAEKAIQKSYVNYIQKEKIAVLSNPEVSIDEAVEGKDLVFKAKVAVMPEVTLNEDYEKEIKKINADYQKKQIRIEEDEIQLELDKLANSRAKLVTVRREARNNDAVEVDFSVLMNNVPIENGSSRKHPLILGKGVFIPGFEEQLLGMKEGEEKEFELTFPKDYHQQDLAGKPATFKVKMNIIQERQLPEINNEFAAAVGKFANLEDLKKNIREGLEHEQKHKLEENQRNEYVDKILEKTQIDMPEILVTDELRKMLEEFEYQIQAMGMNLDDYLKKFKKDRQELEKDWKLQAEKRVKSALSLRKIAKLKEVKVDPKKVEEEINRTLAYYKNMKDAEKNIDLERLYNYTKGVLENAEVFSQLEKM